jgi:hypothetical protein
MQGTGCKATHPSDDCPQITQIDADPTHPINSKKQRTNAFGNALLTPFGRRVSPSQKLSSAADLAPKEQITERYDFEYSEKRR